MNVAISQGGRCTLRAPGRAPVTSAELPMDVDSASVLCKSDTSKEMEANNIDAQTGGGEGGACTAAMNAVSGEIDAPDVTEKLHGGVTAGPPGTRISLRW